MRRGDGSTSVQNHLSQIQRMIRDFSKEELQEEESLRDTELTLGGGTLLVLGGGLVALCALCFGLGYLVGHRNSADNAVSKIVSSPNARSSIAPTGSGSKPAAAGQPPTRPQTQAADEVRTGSSDSTPPAQVAPAVAEKGEESGQPHPKSAVGAEVRSAISTASSALQILPPITKTQGWMVQIAAVSHADDAEVLVNALRRRGYSVSARRDNGDTLIHVQTGPFINRNDANAVRQKLLNDGYNAIVQ